MSIRELVIAAQSGDQKATMDVINRYMWMINEYSRHGGILDDDCKHTILIEVISAIQKYRFAD